VDHSICSLAGHAGGFDFKAVGMSAKAVGDLCVARHRDRLAGAYLAFRIDPRIDHPSGGCRARVLQHLSIVFGT
jgi:hypothetical protein